MCTCIAYQTKNHYFGRNLDLEMSFDQTITVTPRNYDFKFRQVENPKTHYAINGVAYIVDGYPLYYDAANEKGIGMAGLNFAGNAVYHPVDPNKNNVGSFEFIPYILGKCATMDEVKAELENLNIADINFNEQFPASPLHWMISDGTTSIVVESVAEGLKVYDNPAHVLTNNPTFDKQLFGLNDYMVLSPDQPADNFEGPGQNLDLQLFSRGMGSNFLPGGMSSKERFIKVAFTRAHSLDMPDDGTSISQFFHILGSVCQQKGLTHIDGDKYEYTIYSSCCNLDKGVYYCTTYDNAQPAGVDMHKEDLDGAALASYPMNSTFEAVIKN